MQKNKSWLEEMRQFEYICEVCRKKQASSVDTRQEVCVSFSAYLFFAQIEASGGARNKSI